MLAAHIYMFRFSTLTNLTCRPAKLQVTQSRSASLHRLRSSKMASNGPRRTEYLSNHVDIPASFLKGPPAKPVTMTHVPFASSPLPQYEGKIAVVVDNVMSPEECQELLRLVESSVPASPEGDTSPWRPALVNVGVGIEMAITDYRNSDRIIWDEQEIVDRLWDRCIQADGLQELLSRAPDDFRGESCPQWKFERVNNRMRFLKYTPGQFFRAHCDGPYYYDKDGEAYQTQYTIQLYLSDSAKTSPDGKGCQGGATSFLSRDETKRLDVDPKAGSMLIFQHQGLYHEGQEVTEGEKYTMRTDILYRWVDDDEN